MSLARFGVGEIYDLPPTIASYLIALGSAEPLFDHPRAGEPHAEAAPAGDVTNAAPATLLPEPGRER